jgi:hypothetical protein
LTNINNKKRGAAATSDNLKHYSELISEMKATRKKFPINQFGEINISWVAKKVGCVREVLRDGALSKMFLLDVAEIGIEIEIDNNEIDRLSKKAQEKTVEASQLHKLAEKQRKEIEALREQVERLTEENRRLRYGMQEKDVNMDEMLRTGRRFYL